MSIRKRGETWLITLDLGRGPDGKRRRQYITVRGTKRAALEAERKALESARRGADLAIGRLTLEQFLQRWLASRRDLAPMSVATYRKYIARWIEHVGHVRLDQLTGLRIEEVVASLDEQGLAPSTVRGHFDMLRTALRHAERLGLDGNPAQRATPPHAPKVEATPLVLPQVRKLIAAAEPELGRVVLIAYTTGLRVGELAGLHWADVDLVECRLEVRHQAQAVTGQGIVLREPKSRSGRRSIRLARVTIAALTEQRAYLEARWRENGVVPLNGGLVFPDAFGQLRYPPAISGEVAALGREVGLGKIRFHQLRHGNATMLLAGGVPLKSASSRLGHSSTAITAEVYSHITADIETFAADAIDRMMGTPPEREAR